MLQDVNSKLDNILNKLTSSAKGLTKDVPKLFEVPKKESKEKPVLFKPKK